MEVLTGKVAVITGAAKRLSFALAMALAEEDMRLVRVKGDR
jgi:NAD(P)-dependent dehydrogenase (short-subunit alcohol dehydrogenase family)